MANLRPSRGWLLGLGPLGWLLLAGAVMQLGWLLLWTVSPAARVSAKIANPWTSGPASPWEWILGMIAQLGTRFPESGALPGLGVAGSLGLALVVIGAGYLAGIFILDRGVAKLRGAGRIVVGFTLLFQLTLILIPGVFSTDVYSYLAYGQIAGVHGLNPYLVGPDVLVGNPLLQLIYDDWRVLPSPYGPLWTTISAAMAPWTFALDISDQVLIHRVLMNLVHLVNLVLLTWLLKRGLPHARGVRLTAFALFAWNPLLLLELGGNGHNDALMLTLLLAGLIPIARLAPRASDELTGRISWGVGMLLMALSALIKYATLLVGVIATVVWARELRSTRARVVWIGGTLLAVVCVATAMFSPWYAGPQMLSPAVDEINGRYQFHSVPMLVQRSIGQWLTASTDIDPDVAAAGARAWVYGLARLGFVVYLLWEIRRLWTRRDDRPAVQVVCAVSARALMIALLLVLTEVHSWYFAWPLTLVVLLGWSTPLTRLVVGYTLTCLPVDYIALFDWNTAVPSAVRFVLGAGYLVLPFLLPALMYVHRLRPVLALERMRSGAAAALAELP